MIAVTGNLSLGVHREKIGDIGLDDLRPGEYRNVTNAELQHLWTNTPLEQCSEDYVFQPPKAQRRKKKNTHLKKRFEDPTISVDEKKYKQIKSKK